MELLQKYPNAVCLKRKLVDSYLTKDSKSRRVEVDNVSFKVGSGSSSDPHAHRCRNQPNLANDCVNYLNSTVLTRVVFYKEGPWCSFPEKVVPSLVDAFKGDKSSVVVMMDDQPLLLDFLSVHLYGTSLL
uniref:RCD1 WWE domain-containing protein n=1 Tax=Setaria italica TaxID=4555 RepID=K3XZZ7_SETIT